MTHSNPLITSFLGSLRQTKNINPQNQTIEDWAARGETELLYQLAVALQADAKTYGALAWVVESLFNFIKRALALTSGLQQVETLLQLVQLPRKSTTHSDKPDSRHSRYLASLLAVAQTPHILFAVLERHFDDEECELMFLLLHEMVLRGIPCDQVPISKRYAEKMRRIHHPLAPLPLTLTEIEREINLPQYGLRDSSSSLPYSYETDNTSTADASLHNENDYELKIEETTSREIGDRIKAAVINWQNESNGVIEVKTFQFNRCLEPKDVSSRLLMLLNLDCLLGASESNISLQSISPSHAFHLLFASAAQGGAYNDGERGACGRLAAWQSLGGLVAADPTSSIEILLEQVLRCKWFSFLAQTQWFSRVAWDLGIVVLRPPGNSLAVLAATDTD